MDLPSLASTICGTTWTLIADAARGDGQGHARRRRQAPAPESSSLHDKVANPINPGNRKVLIFTAFADTANYLYANLAPELCASRRLHTAMVTGSGTPQDHARQGLRLPGAADAVLAALQGEGHRPAQRDRRDRRPDRHRLHLRRPEPPGLRLPRQLRHPLEPGADHPALRPHRPHRLAPTRSIQLVNYWPDISLDEYINLKERVENRMVIADVTATGDDNVLTAASQRHRLPQGAAHAGSRRR